MKKLLLLLVFGFFVLNASIMNGWSQETIDFEELPVGTVVGQVFGDGGSGPIIVFGENPNAPAINAAVIFDSANPSGDPCGGGLDFDLGTPNEKFGGPGVGVGGASGPFANMVAQGNILIINEACGLWENPVPRPNDADLLGASFDFDFSNVGSGTVTIYSITIIDVEPDEPSAKVELFDGFDNLLSEFTLPQTGNNGVAITGLGYTPGVAAMVVTLNGSGAIDNIVFETEHGGGEGCTPGYWKQEHHFGSWTAPYGSDKLFSEVFEDAFPGKTLVDVLDQGGGHLFALGRHTVAALLNAASPDVSYDLAVNDVIEMFNDVYPDGDYESLKDFFEGLNEQGCPLGNNKRGKDAGDKPGTASKDKKDVPDDGGNFEPESEEGNEGYNSSNEGLYRTDGAESSGSSGGCFIFTMFD
jgi:hypothetical protein